MPGGSGPELVLNPVSPSQQGHYICRVSSGDKYVFSNWVHVRLLRSGGSSAGMWIFYLKTYFRLEGIKLPSTLIHCVICRCQR